MCGYTCFGSDFGTTHIIQIFQVTTRCYNWQQNSSNPFFTHDLHSTLCFLFIYLVIICSECNKPGDVIINVDNNMKAGKKGTSLQNSYKNVVTHTINNSKNYCDKKLLDYSNIMPTSPNPIYYSSPNGMHSQVYNAQLKKNKKIQ